MSLANLPPDVDRTWYPVITHSVLTPIAFLVTAFRLTARYTSSGLKWDDLFIILAMLCAIANWPFTITGRYWGVGRHAAYLELPHIIAAVKTLVVGEFLLLLGLCFVKVSVILFMLAISGVNRIIRYTLLSNLVLIVLSTIAFCIVLWVQCTPITGNWDPTVPDRKCIPVENFMAAVYVLSAITIVTDFLCALLPLPIIWKLQLSTKKRLGIMSVIGLGLLAAASSIVRIVLVKEFKHSREDPTMALLDVGVWTLIELHIGIIVASLPPCRALVIKLYDRARGRVGTKSYGSNNGTSSGGLSGIELTRSVVVQSEKSRAGAQGYHRMDNIGKGPSSINSDTSRLV